MQISRMHKIQRQVTDIRDTKMPQAWNGYIGKLFHDKRKYSTTSRNEEVPEVFISKMASSIAKLNEQRRRAKS